MHIVHNAVSASRVRAMNDESMDLYRSLGDDVGFYYGLGTAGLIAVGQGRPQEGLPRRETGAEHVPGLFVSRSHDGRDGVVDRLQRSAEGAIHDAVRVHQQDVVDAPHSRV